MDAGLDLNDDFLVEYVLGNEQKPLNANYYKLEKSTDGKSFTLTFPDYYKVKPYDRIIVTYTAKVNANAIVGTPQENKAQLTYSRNPTVDGKYRTEETKTKVYTYGLEVYKYTTEKSGRIPLSGAIFKLQQLQKVEGKDVFVDIRTDKTFISGSKGEIFIDNLEPGTYKLVELQAPGGYNAIESIDQFTITPARNSNETLTGKVCGRNSAYYLKEVPNYKSVLPITGGSGTVIFTVVGIVLMLGAVIYLVIRKRMSATVR